MKTILPILCLTLCLTGCSKPTTDTSSEQIAQVAEEMQKGINELRTQLLSSTALDDIRYALQTGDMTEKTFRYNYEGYAPSETELSAEFKAVKESLQVGYDWVTQTYTCLYKVESPSSYAYITTEFNSDFECINLYSTRIKSKPYIGTPTAPNPFEEYIPFPEYDPTHDIDSRIPDDTSSEGTTSTGEGSTDTSSDTSTTSESSTDTSSDNTTLSESSTDTSSEDTISDKEGTTSSSDTSDTSSEPTSQESEAT